MLAQNQQPNIEMMINIHLNEIRKQNDTIVALLVVQTIIFAGILLLLVAIAGSIGARF